MSLASEVNLVLCVAVIGHHSQGWLINNGNVFFTVVETAEFRIKALAEWVSGEGPSWVHRWLSQVLIVSLGGGKGNFLGSFLQRHRSHS